MEIEQLIKYDMTDIEKHTAELKQKINNEKNIDLSPEGLLPNFHPIDRCCGTCARYSDDDEGGGFCRLLISLEEDLIESGLDLRISKYMCPVNLCDFWRKREDKI